MKLCENGNEYYFKQGADAMQSKIAAWLMTKDLFDLATSVLKLEMPMYQEREQVIINHPPPKMWSHQEFLRNGDEK